MDRDVVIAMLRHTRAALEAVGAAHVALFGSVARGEATAESDIDVVVTLQGDVRMSGLDYVGTIETLRETIAGFTGRHVDILPEPIHKESLRLSVERDRAVAF